MKPPDHIEKTPAGVIDWKMEAERSARLLADAQKIIAEYKAQVIEAARQIPMSEWQPIETKPKHHFPVLVWGPFGHRVAFEDVAWIWWEPAAVEPMDWKPSHWMPLPARPILQTTPPRKD